MKLKTSIMLSDYIVEELDKNLDHLTNRSEFIENAIRAYLETKNRKKRNKNDLDILNNLSENLNKEAADVLSYQVNI